MLGLYPHNLMQYYIQLSTQTDVSTVLREAKATVPAGGVRAAVSCQQWVIIKPAGLRDTIPPAVP